MSPPALIVFSHLRWDFVFQRPQHVLSRLARRRRVVFIEEPAFAEGATSSWQKSQPMPNVLVCRPVTPVSMPGFNDAQFPAITALLAQLFVTEGLESYLTWFYTPMALPLLDGLKPEA